MSISLADEYKLDSEAIALILKARQIENNSIDSKLAQTLYEQVVVAYPDYAVGLSWNDSHCKHGTILILYHIIYFKRVVGFG